MKKIKAIVISFASLAITASASAQYARGDGRINDRNKRVGSGGFNAPAKKYQFNYGNYIVTGNVGGLKYFHGDVGYRAPGTFQGTLGSTDLFRFKAQSAPVQTKYGTYKRPIYETFQSNSNTKLSIVSTFNRQRKFQAIKYNTYKTGSTLIRKSQLARITANTINFYADSQGTIKETIASPLVGVRSITAYKTFKWLSDDLNVNKQLNSYINKKEKDKQINKRVYSHGKIFGLELTKMISEKNISKENKKKLEQSISNIEKQLLQPISKYKTDQKNKDVYVDILSEFKEKLDNYQKQKKQNTQEQPESKSIYQQPSPQQRYKAKQDKILNSKSAYGLKKTEKYIDPLEKNFSHLPLAMKNFINALDNTHIKISKFSTKKSNALINQWFQKAEKYMLNQEYFRSQKIYQSILNIKPGHPLARVGLINAQFGAGLIKSATRNLRELLVDHPELITVKYSGQVIPSPRRMRQIKNNIEKQIKNNKSNATAIALAYIAYQGNAPKLTQYALDIAQTKNPKDTLVSLLQRLWIQNKKIENKKKPKKIIKTKPKANPKKMQSETKKRNEKLKLLEGSLEE